jgi:hypothetical protein
MGHFGLPTPEFCTKRGLSPIECVPWAIFYRDTTISTCRIQLNIQSLPPSNPSFVPTILLLYIFTLTHKDNRRAHYSLAAIVNAEACFVPLPSPLFERLCARAHRFRPCHSRDSRRYVPSRTATRRIFLVYEPSPLSCRLTCRLASRAAEIGIFHYFSLPLRPVLFTQQNPNVHQAHSKTHFL